MIFLFYCSPSMRNTHTATLFCLPIHEPMFERKDAATVAPLPFSLCAMKLIIALEIIDSHGNLDIFRGIDMIIRLYSKLDTLPTPPSLSISSPHLLVFIFPRLLSSSWTRLQFFASFFLQYILPPDHYIITLSTLSLGNFFFAWLRKCPQPASMRNC